MRVTPCEVWLVAEVSVSKLKGSPVGRACRYHARRHYARRHYARSFLAV